MRLKGYEVRRATHLGWRQANPEIDRDLHGHAIEHNYVVIVSKAACPKYERDGRRYYNPDGVRGLPIYHFGTYYGCGAARHYKNPIWISGQRYTEYWTRPLYFVRDAQVYVGTMHYPEKPYGYDDERAYLASLRGGNRKKVESLTHA